MPMPSMMPMIAVSSSSTNRFCPLSASNCIVRPKEMPEMLSAPTTMPAAAPIRMMSSAARPVSRMARSICAGVTRLPR